MKGKKALYYDEAFRLYLSGKTLKDISGILPVSEQSLCKWKADEKWDELMKSYISTPGGSAEILKQQINALIKDMQDKGLDAQDLVEKSDAISKVAAVVRTLEGKEDFLGSALRVTRRFAEFIRERYPDRAEEMSVILREFLSVVERER